MIKKISILIFFCGFFSTMLLHSQSAVCNYKYRKRIAFDPTKVMTAADITNYTALINITADADLETVTTYSGHVENANGYDIIFTADDGVTKLDHYLEKYTASSGALTAWVRIPNLSTTYNTYIYMYYGNTAISTDQSVSTTWNSVYRNAYFFNSDYNDKSQGGNNGTNNGLTVSAGTGTIANYVVTNNVNDYVAIGTNGWSASAGTYEVWASSSTWNAAEGYFLGHTSTVVAAPAYNNRIQIYSYNGKLRVGLGSAHSIPNNTDLFTFATNRWYHVAVVYSSGNHTVYVNGTSVYTGTYSGLSLLNSTADVANDGNPAAHNESMGAGGVDNMFIQNVARDATWMATTYNNQSSPSTFYSISTEPKVWIGGTNTNYNAAANWLNNSAPSSGNDVIINNGANQPTLQGNEQVAGLWIKSGATLSLGNNSLSVRFDITNCGTLSNNSGTVVCNATSTNIATQYFSGSGTFNLKSLTVNNTHTASPNLTLSKNVTVNGTLTLASGTVYTSATNILALSNTAVSTSGSSTSFVSGPMSKTGNTDFVFPVGKGANRWRRCAVTGITASDTYTAEYFYNPYASATPITSPLIDVSKIEYWQVDRAATGNASLTLYWEAANTSGINNCPDLTIARWSGAAWQERQGTAGGTCSGAGSGSVITNAVLTAFSPFTFGSKSSAVNPLPITLLSFSASPIEDAVLTRWETATETNNDRFEVERTDDGLIFETVGTVKGSGTTSTKRSYVFTDEKPLKGVSYYRLKQVDTDGKDSYSAMVSVDRSKKLDYVLYPNPTKGEFVLEGSVENAQVVVYNILGELVEYNVYGRTAGLIHVDCSTLPKGVYYINVKTNTETKINKLVIE